MYDLHTHSTCSDGRLNPRELILKAREIKDITGIALTDHDNTDGLIEASRAASECGLSFIYGVEFTTDFYNREAHILGYNIDINNTALREKFALLKKARFERVHEMVDKLEQHGLNISWDEVSDVFKTHGFAGRALLFRVMKERGLIDPLQRQKYFNYYIGSGGVAYVPHRGIETIESIELIIAAGGIPVLAHPGRLGEESIIKKLAAVGLQGIEAYYPTHTKDMTKKYLKLAETYHLLVTGGSDFHADKAHAQLGCVGVSELPWG